ncbi:hypothetical protein FISHEDRAFT_59616 [Fistulina hepatica ATCC 64428]|uniref:FAS1 domain-containing protein n=1 Tax=Fistulina hepatica ATCC 64428 TaxID=1128425 RepID=A0A0D7AC44_9AGAR|nr:hypothetical protein FISHEDRAFT_59616 [Fistulina hepatica ATCC 64428]
MVSRLLSLILLAPFVFAQNISSSNNSTQSNTTYINNLATEFEKSGLTSLASLVNSSDDQLFSSLGEDSSRSYVLFAPSNDASKSVFVFLCARKYAETGVIPVAAVSNSTLNNSTLLASILSYHVVVGNFTAGNNSSVELISAQYPNVTIGRTLMNNSDSVHLEGGKSQVLAWTNYTDLDSNSSVVILNQASNVTILDTTVFENLLISTVSAVLLPPSNISTVLGPENNLTSIGSSIQNVNVSYSSSDANTTSFQEVLEASAGYTFFAPSNAALAAGGNALAVLAGNNSALAALLGNHIINGTTLYSPLITHPQNYTSAAVNATGTFVWSGFSGDSPMAARIGRTDLLTENGVVHIIEGILTELDTNSSAASSAYASATSAAAEQSTATESGPLTATQITTSASSTATDNTAVAGKIGEEGGILGILMALMWIALGALAL